MWTQPPFGLAGFVFGSDHEQAKDVAKKIKSGYVMVNSLNLDFSVPFGGYKQSGTGSEMGVLGIEEYLEVKSIPNYFTDNLENIK